jgi:ornithine decarboxylase
MKSIARNLIHQHKLTDSFYIVDLKKLDNKINLWKSLLPKITPFYAIKCNPDEEVIKYMIKKNINFDCASKDEIKTVMNSFNNQGISNLKDKIIYSHPVKKIEDLKFAVNNNIQYTVFDSISELEKLKKYAPNIKCLIRLHVDNPSARIQLGLKYGVHYNEYKELINIAKDSNINLVGTSFHVGSASKDPNVFNTGLNYCKEVFNYATNKGFNMNLLDIGGGFTKDNFEDCATVINNNIKENFDNIKIIAEPGRFFAEEIFTFFTQVIGNRTRNNINEYFIGDGLYGSFNCILYDDQIPEFEIIKKDKDVLMLEDSMLFGATCDSADKIGIVKLPKLQNGDFLMIRNFGAYTLAGACNFNGINMTNPKIFYILEELKSK